MINRNPTLCLAKVIVKQIAYGLQNLKTSKRDNLWTIWDSTFKLRDQLYFNNIKQIPKFEVAGSRGLEIITFAFLGFWRPYVERRRPSRE